MGKLSVLFDKLVLSRWGTLIIGLTFASLILFGYAVLFFFSKLGYAALLFFLK